MVFPEDGASPRTTLLIRIDYTYNTQALRHPIVGDTTASKQEAIQSSRSWCPRCRILFGEQRRRGLEERPRVFAFLVRIEKHSADYRD